MENIYKYDPVIELIINKCLSNKQLDLSKIANKKEHHISGLNWEIAVDSYKNLCYEISIFLFKHIGFRDIHFPEHTHTIRVRVWAPTKETQSIVYKFGYSKSMLRASVFDKPLRPSKELHPFINTTFKNSFYSIKNIIKIVSKEVLFQREAYYV